MQKVMTFIKMLLIKILDKYPDWKAYLLVMKEKK